MSNSHKRYRTHTQFSFSRSSTPPTLPEPHLYNCRNFKFEPQAKTSHSSQPTTLLPSGSLFSSRSSSSSCSHSPIRTCFDRKAWSSHGSGKEKTSASYLSSLRSQAIEPGTVGHYEYLLESSLLPPILRGSDWWVIRDFTVKDNPESFRLKRHGYVHVKVGVQCSLDWKRVFICSCECPSGRNKISNGNQMCDCLHAQLMTRTMLRLQSYTHTPAAPQWLKDLAGTRRQLFGANSAVESAVKETKNENVLLLAEFDAGNLARVFSVFLDNDPNEPPVIVHQYKLNRWFCKAHQTARCEHVFQARSALFPNGPDDGQEILSEHQEKPLREREDAEALDIKGCTSRLPIPVPRECVITALLFEHIKSDGARNGGANGRDTNEEKTHKEDAEKRLLEHVDKLAYDDCHVQLYRQEQKNRQIPTGSSFTCVLLEGYELPQTDKGTWKVIAANEPGKVDYVYAGPVAIAASDVDLVVKSSNAPLTNPEYQQLFADWSVQMDGINVLAVDLNHLYASKTKCDCAFPHLPIWVHVPARHYRSHSDESSLLYRKDGCNRVAVYAAKCSGCGKIIEYDGLDDRIFNMNNRHLFMHDVLNGYTVQFTKSETSFNAYCNQIVSDYQENGSREPFVSRTFFEECWFNFINLQDFGYKFSCPWCGTEPDEVIFDGIMMCIPQRGSWNLQPPTHIHQDRLPEDPVTRSKLSLEFFPKHDASVREALLSKVDRWPNTSPHDDSHSFTAYPAIKRILYDLNWTDLSHAQCNALRRVLRVLATAEPLSAFVHFRVAGLLQEMLEWHSTPAGFEYEDVLRAVCPAIYDLWKAYPNFLPVYVKDLVKVIIDRSKEIENAMPEIGELPSLPEHDPLRQPDRKHSRYRVTGAYYGAHIKRVRPRYNIDSNLHKPKKGQCEKMFLTHQHQTGGIMIAWCKHRIAVGFHIIPRQEGRNDVYSVLYQRWQKAPRTIVYDFACQLHKYSITREAAFFRDTKHVIDEHHSDNHTACSEAYRMKPYKQYNDEWTFFNDSAAECGNSGLAKAKLSSSYMGLARFMDFARLQLEFQNRKRILKLVDLHKSSSLSDARPQWQVIQTKMTYLHQKHAAITAHCMKDWLVGLCRSENLRRKK